MLRHDIYIFCKYAQKKSYWMRISASLQFGYGQWIDGKSSVGLRQDNLKAEVKACE